MVDKARRLLSLRRTAITGNVAALVVALISLSLATLMVARIGGPSSVGDYALLRVMPWLLAVMVSGGLAAATPWFLAGPTRDDPRVKMTLLAIGGAASVGSLAIWLAAAPLLRDLFLRDLTTLVVAWAGLKTVSRLVVITAKAASQGTGDLRGTNFAIALEELLFIPGYAVALLLGVGGGSAVVAALIAADVVTGALAWRRLLGRHYFAGAGRPSFELAKRIYIFGLRGQVGSIMYLVNLRLDFMIVDLLAGPAVLGIYAVASKFAELVRLLPISFEWVLYPRFAGKTASEAWSWAAWLAPRAAAATAVAALPIALLASPVIPLFYGAAFQGAVEPTRLLLIGLSIEGASGVVTAYLFGRGRPGLNSLATLGGVIVTVLLDFLLIPRFQLVGASLASTAAYLTTTSLLGLCFLLMQPRSAERVIDIGDPIPPGTFRRSLDILVSSAFLVLLSPVMLAAWIGARLSTGASGVYRQARVGEGGRAFTMLKFRSMRPSEGPEITVSGDRRVTRLGGILRATSIDELPQLVNVLRGEMTLVGARPETVGLAQRYPKHLQTVFRHRPGLTGPAQLRLRQDGDLAPSDDVESEYLEEQVPRRVAEDMDYLSRPTPARTCALIGGTAAYVTASLLGMRDVRAHGHLHASSRPRSSYAHRSPWQLLTPSSAIQIELPASSAARHELRRQVLELSPGTDVVVCCTALTSNWRTRRFAREAGIDIVREYVAIPSMAPPTCYVENTPLTLRHFFTEVSVLPGGGPTISALLAAAKQAARFMFPASLIGALAPTRLVIGRVSSPATAPSVPVAADRALEASGLLDVHDMETIVLAMSKDPNAKLTVLLVPRGQSKPALAVKVPTTEVAEGSVLAERRLLAELEMRLPPQLLVTIPRLTEVGRAQGSPILVVSALPGSPMSTRYHGWRHVATRSAVEADFKMAGSWLARFQVATAGEKRPIDMDGGVAEILRSRFADDPAIEGALSRLQATQARLRASTGPRTAVHGDFWFGNLLAIGEQLSGVIDWESGAISGEPLRDVVRFAITYALYLDRHSPAGGRVAGHRGLRSGVWGSGIEFALDGSGWFSDLFRGFIAGGLSRLGADPARWRDAALAGIAEVAATADHDAFARLHLQLFGRLSARSSQFSEKPVIKIPSAFAIVPGPAESTSPASAPTSNGVSGS